MSRHEWGSTWPAIGVPWAAWGHTSTFGLPTSPPSQLLFKCLLQVPGLFSFSTLLFLSDPSCPVETHCSLTSPLGSEESKSRYVPQSLQSQTGQGGERSQGQHALRARRSSQTQGLHFYVKKGWEALATSLFPGGVVFLKGANTNIKTSSVQ